MGDDIKPMDVDVLTDRSYIARYDFYERSVSGTITINLSMVDMAGNTSNINQGISTLDLQLSYPTPAVVRFSQFDDVMRTAYINTLNNGLLFWISVTYDSAPENELKNVNKYLIDFNQDARPRVFDTRWIDFNASADVTDNIGGEISTWDVTRNVIDYSQIIDLYGVNGQRFLTTDIYVWVKNKKGDVSEFATTWSITVDVHEPLDTLEWQPLNDVDGQLLTIAITIDEALDQ